MVVAASPLQDCQASGTARSRSSPGGGGSSSLWRRPPEQSFSDFTLRVIVIKQGTWADASRWKQQKRDQETGDKQHERFYFLHKCVLAGGGTGGPCDYFATLFRYKNAGFGDKNYCTLVLPEMVALALDTALDFIYGSSTTSLSSVIAATKQQQPCEFTAVALYQLGQYLAHRQLRLEAKRYWRSQLNMRNCHLYYQAAICLGQESKLLQAIAEVCAKEFCYKQQQQLPEIVEVMHPLFWLDVFEVYKQLREFDRKEQANKQHNSSQAQETVPTEEQKLRLCRLVTETCRAHSELVNAELLERLFAAHLLLALPLLSLDASSALTILEWQQQKNYSNVLLEQHCIEVVAQQWRHKLLQEESNPMLGSPRVLWRLLQNVMKVAQTESVQQMQQITSLKASLENQTKELTQTKSRLKKYRERLKKQETASSASSQVVVENLAIAASFASSTAVSESSEPPSPAVAEECTSSEEMSQQMQHGIQESKHVVATTTRKPAHVVALVAAAFKNALLAGCAVLPVWVILVCCTPCLVVLAILGAPLSQDLAGTM